MEILIEATGSEEGEASFRPGRRVPPGCLFHCRRLNCMRQYPELLTHVPGCPPDTGNGRGEIQVVRKKGVVKWFNAAKGYGFIQRTSGEDVFVHFSAIEMSGYRTLDEGSEVEFEVKKGPKGLQAENVNR